MATPREYPIHPLARLTPRKTPEEQDKLKEDIKHHGLLVPIIRWRGQVIDGRHRLAACLKVDIEPRFEDLPDHVDPAEYVLALIATQRHVTPSQLSLSGAEISQSSTRGRPRGQDENCVDLRNITQGEAPDMLGISCSLVTHANRLVADGTNAVPELVEAVKSGLAQVTDASKMVDHAPEVQWAGVEMVVKGEAKTIPGAVRKILAAAADQDDDRAMEANLALPMAERVMLHHAFVSVMGTLVEAASVDAIISQPPHNEGSLPLYASLAGFAVHALKESGVLVVVGSGTLLPQILKNLDSAGLIWSAEFDLLFQGDPFSNGRPDFLNVHPPSAAGLPEAGLQDHQHARPHRSPPSRHSACRLQPQRGRQELNRGAFRPSRPDRVRPNDAGPQRSCPGSAAPRLHLQGRH